MLAGKDLRITNPPSSQSSEHSWYSLQAEATTNKGGGKAGLMDRLGGAAGHAKFICPLCKMQAPSIKNMEEHHEVECSNI